VLGPKSGEITVETITLDEFVAEDQHACLT
jgi:hypothetical protein